MQTYTTIEKHVRAELVERKSRFIATLAPVKTEEDAQNFISEIRSEHRMARHNVYAYILRENARVRYSDDGEPQKTAGLPALETLKHAGLSDVAVVVTRYFGGILLGTGGLIRAYTQATQLAIEQAQLLVISPCRELVITTSYALYDSLLHTLKANNTRICDTQFSDVVTLTVRILDGDEKPLLKQLTELFRGEENVRVSEVFDAAF